MHRTRLLLAALLLGILLAAYLVLSPPRKTRGEGQAPLSSASAGEVTGPVALAANPGAPQSASAPAPEPPWWFEEVVRPASPATRSARIEAAWWSAKPASPLEEPEAVFVSGEVDLSRGDAPVKVVGNATEGWAVLFVVAGGRRALADPWTADPVYRVQPGRGWGGSRSLSGEVVAVVAGGRDLVLCAVDRDGAPVSDLEVDARVPDGDRFQRRRTDAEGRARFSAFPAAEALVSWRSGERRTSGEGEESFAKEFPDGKPRRVLWGEEPEVVVSIPRNPRLRLRVRIDGAADDGWCPATYVYVQDARGQGHTWKGAYGFFLPPGTWTCRTYVFGAGNVLATAKDLALDADVTLDVPASLSADMPWLDVSFVGGGSPSGVRVASAIEARRTEGSGGWSGAQASAPHHRIVVPLPPGEYELTGAQRSATGVRISDPLRISVRPGDRPSFALATSPAGAIAVPPTPAGSWNDRLSLLEREFPGTGVVEDTPFRFIPLSNRDRPATWWLPSGTWTLARLVDDGPEQRWHVAFEAKPGRVLRLRESGGGFTIEGN